MRDLLAAGFLDGGFFEKSASFLEGGSYLILIPLLLIGFWMWFIILERASFLGTRKRKAAERERFLATLETYAREPIKANQDTLLAECGTLPVLYRLFFHRFFRLGSLGSKESMELKLAQAELMGARERERGLSLLKALTRAALFLGLFGTVAGMSHALRSMTLTYPGEAEALGSGASMAFLAAEAGIAVTLQGIVGMSWLSRRARSLKEDMDLTSFRLRESIGRALPEAFV